MAEGDESARQGTGGEGAGQPELAALSARVLRLERELAALQRQMEATGMAPEARLGPEPVSALEPGPALEGALAEGGMRPVGGGFGGASRVGAVAPPPRPDGGAAGGPREGRLWQGVQAAWTGNDGGAAQAAQAAKARSFESRLGSQLFNRVAIVLLLVGAAYGLKLAVDRGLVGPTGRVVLGLAAGAGLVLWSERFRARGFATFSYSLKAVGSGLLYLSLWAAFQLFHLLPGSAALALMLGVTAWNAYMAWVQRSELLAGYALAGGFATPLLLSTGGNHETFLFMYLLAMDAAAVGLARLRGWPRLLAGAFPLTVAFFTAWYARYFAADALGQTAAFAALFAVTFASAPLELGERVESGAPRLRLVLEEILLPLADAGFLALALAAMLEDAGRHAWLPWEMVVLAAAWLGLMRLPQGAVARAVHLAIAVTLLTVAIPLKASGAWITVGWLTEGVALVWAATRVGTEDETQDGVQTLAGRVLQGLGGAALLLGFAGVCAHELGAAEMWDAPLLNRGLVTAVAGLVAFAVAAGMALRAGEADGRRQWTPLAQGLAALVGLTAATLTLRELGPGWLRPVAASHPAFRTAEFGSALLALAVLAGVARMAGEVARRRPEEAYWPLAGASATVALNLLAVLTGVREISAVWNPTNAATLPVQMALEQALAISGFLMLYGACLLAAGFVWRSAFLRWQALGLLTFTICKTFVYDLRNLSQGYRVASLLGLGTLLMAISYAYQRDWLGLREPERTPETRGETIPARNDGAGEPQ